MMAYPPYAQGYVPQGIVSITPSDTTLLEHEIRGFMVTVEGNVSVLMKDGSEGVMPLCAPGVQYGGAILRINATGTAATGIVGLL